MRASIYIAAGSLVLTAVPGLAADRAPTAAERTGVENSLRAAGFVSWEEIEFDDDGPYLEVDDARLKDKSKYDLKLDPKSYKIVRRSKD